MTGQDSVYRVVACVAGGPEVLELEEVARPTPGAGEVRIAVRAAGVAFGDVQARQGRYPGRFPIVPGYDVVGAVDAVGPGVTGISVGQRVAAYTGNGGYTTSAVARAVLTVALPDQVDMTVAAALPLNYVTAWQLLNRAAHVPAGGSILVLGAAGGVGSALTELALQQGLAVYGTASPPRRPALAERGVRVLNNRQDLPASVDATFDPIGGPSLALSRRATRRGGTVVAYGLSHASTADLSRTRGIATALGALARAKLTPGARVVTFQIGASIKKDPAAYAADLARLLDLLAADQLHPQVETMPLTEAAEAHRRLEDRTVLGKLVLTT